MKIRTVPWNFISLLGILLRVWVGVCVWRLLYNVFLTAGSLPELRFENSLEVTTSAANTLSVGDQVEHSDFFLHSCPPTRQWHAPPGVSGPYSTHSRSPHAVSTPACPPLQVTWATVLAHLHSGFFRDPIRIWFSDANSPVRLPPLVVIIICVFFIVSSTDFREGVSHLEGGKACVFHMILLKASAGK